MVHKFVNLLGNQRLALVDRVVEIRIDFLLERLWLHFLLFVHIEYVVNLVERCELGGRMEREQEREREEETTNMFFYFFLACHNLLAVVIFSGS